MEEFDFDSLPSASSCKLISFDKVEVHPGKIPKICFLTVGGTKPCINMEVRLVPLFYLKCPEYWGIEVIGCLSDGICIPTLGSYEMTIPLAGITGYKGIEVIGAKNRKKLDVSGGCKENDKF